MGFLALRWFSVLLWLMLVGSGALWSICLLEHNMVGYLSLFLFIPGPGSSTLLEAGRVTVLLVLNPPCPST